MNTDSKSNAGPERDRIDTYLDDVCAEFTFMPSTDVERNRLELRQHIEAMVDDIVDTEGERAKPPSASLLSDSATPVLSASESPMRRL